MRLTIFAVGRLKAGPETELVARYAKRFDGAGRALGLGPLVIQDLPESRESTAALRKQDEAARLLDKAGRDAVVIALDERGRSVASTAFADLLAKIRDDGAPEAAFLIGGPDGHGEAALAASRETLSLGAMTLPHGLARVVLVEQLYRAVTILSGHPYHRA